MKSHTLVLASGNAGKLRELSAALQPLGFTLRPISDWTDESPEETGATFVENALIKARHAAKVTGLPALADDSGLAVDALDGAPGVYSARYAGDNATDADNNRKLLLALSAFPKPEQRSAHFQCVIACVRDAGDPRPLIAEGRWDGQIALQPVGDEGFGYDPLFYVPDLDCTAAQLDRATKLEHSHRGKAVKALRNQLGAL